MKKLINILVSLLLLISIAFLYTNCKKEEIVIVYSKVQTVGTSNTTSTSTQVNGLVEELTETTHNEYGVCWGTSKDPTVYDSKELFPGAAALGAFSVNIDGLDPSTTYHVRAFVLDKKKYVYGIDRTFTTSAAVLPVVSTASVSGITSVYAISGGNVTVEGDKPVIAKGICFDTIASPTILKNKTIDGWSAGSFVSKLSNLKPSKTYYAKAYAISEFGVSYGNQVTFTTKKQVFSFLEDFDNNLNDWYEGTSTYGNAEFTGGEYVCTYHQEGYLWRVWNNLSEFPAVANTKDFEVNLSIKNQTYDPDSVNFNMTGGLLWDCGSSTFKFFGIRKNFNKLSGTTYSYTIGAYTGSYNVWIDYTTFSGSEYNKLTIKKGSGYYYFFVNDVQVHKQSYTSITEDGIGFYISDAKLSVDYLNIEQKGEKKSINTELLEWISTSAGKQDAVRSPVDQ